MLDGNSGALLESPGKLFGHCMNIIRMPKNRRESRVSHLGKMHLYVCIYIYTYMWSKKKRLCIVEAQSRPTLGVGMYQELQPLGNHLKLTGLSACAPKKNTILK